MEFNSVEGFCGLHWLILEQVAIVTPSVTELARVSDLWTEHSRNDMRAPPGLNAEDSRDGRFDVPATPINKPMKTERETCLAARST